ncbi:STAS domain-containing protein [Streptomyces sp. NPDC060194]|uniref:STAS domain-containing protein n=1 Tax=Streptomyces sp. NPDC060194 TaxID=3347069 RepID=UPI003656D8B1
MPHPLDPETTTAADDGVLRLELRGYLDHGNCDRFLDHAGARLAATPRVRALRLDCAGLEGLDSMGLATLLMLHRRATAAGVRLHLANRPPVLERMLTVTGTLDHLVPDHRARSGPQNRSSQGAYRSTPDDGVSGSGPADADAEGPGAHV